MPSTSPHGELKQDPSNQPCIVPNKLYAGDTRNITIVDTEMDQVMSSEKIQVQVHAKILLMIQVMIHPMLQEMIHFMTQAMILITFQSQRHPQYKAMHQEVRQHSSHHKCQHDTTISSTVALLGDKMRLDLKFLK